ncbi:hypothetical protein Bbelb_405830 [Branchiostoma belcheri]|nr:hypothetical protein Bbelb_405830 [Branchiostoma belcheri]
MIELVPGGRTARCGTVLRVVQDNLRGAVDCQDGDCECPLVCQNCGELDTDTCTCSCKDGWDGLDCADLCNNTYAGCYENPGYPQAACGRLAMLQTGCREMCGYCVEMCGYCGKWRCVGTAVVGMCGYCVEMCGYCGKWRCVGTAVVGMCGYCGKWSCVGTAVVGMCGYCGKWSCVGTAVVGMCGYCGKWRCVGTAVVGVCGYCAFASEDSGNTCCGGKICHNGGVLDTVNDCTCTCMNGFHGENCQHEDVVEESLSETTGPRSTAVSAGASLALFALIPLVKTFAL